MARTIKPAKVPRINFPIKASLRKALNRKAKEQGLLIPKVLSDLVAEYVKKEGE